MARLSLSASEGIRVAQCVMHEKVRTGPAFSDSGLALFRP